mgnify:CR=1 FL=1
MSLLLLALSLVTSKGKWMRFLPFGMRKKSSIFNQTFKQKCLRLLRQYRSLNGSLQLLKS